MPYIPCEEAWCDYPEQCWSDHWVPDDSNKEEEEEEGEVD